MGNCQGAPQQDFASEDGTPHESGVQVARAGSTVYDNRRAHMHKTPKEVLQRVQQVADAMADITNRSPSSDVEWLNFAVKEIWPYVNKSVQKIVQEEVECNLKAAVPSLLKGIHFEKFDLGENPPLLGPVNAAKVGGSASFEHDGHPGVELNIGLDWNCNATISLAVPPAFSIGIKALNLQGEVMVILRPLMKSMPIVGGIQITMVSPPSLSWDLTGVGQVVDMPTISAALKRAITNVISQRMVLPNRIFIHWVWGREHEIDISAMQYPMPEALLRIGVVEAEGLKAMDFNIIGKATSDPYVRIKVGDREHTTKVISRDLNPKWGEDGWGDFLMYTPKQHLVIDIYDHDLWNHKRTDDFIGELLIVNPARDEGRKVCLFELMQQPDKVWEIYAKHRDWKSRKPKYKYEKTGQIRIKVEAYSMVPESKEHISRPPTRHGAADADILLSVQMRGLRGLPKKLSNGATISILVNRQDENGNTKEEVTLKSIGSTYFEETIDESVQDVNPTIQRMVEYFHMEKKPMEQIVNVSGLSEEQIHRILQRHPSFHAKWDQSIHIPLHEPEKVTLHFRLHIARDIKGCAAITVAQPFSLKDKVLDNMMKFEELLVFQRENGPPGLENGPFELDVCVQAHGFEELPLADVQRGSDLPRKVGSVRAAPAV